MLVISSGEFRSNQKYYLDKVDNNETVIVQRGKDKSYVISPISEKHRLDHNPEFESMVAEAMEEYKKGESIVVEDIDEYLGLK